MRIRSLTLLGALCGMSAFASLTPKVTFSGNIRYSFDGSGSNTGSATIRANKPSSSATVHAAYLLAASTGYTGYAIVSTDIHLDEAAITFTDEINSGIDSKNYWTDVSSLVRSKLNSAAPGIVNFTVTENNTDSIDGEILAVIWDDPTAPPTTITLLFGAQQTTGDTFTVTLAQPIDKTNPATILDMSLGISYGYQNASGTGQYSILRMGVNGTLISSSAGGQDDGAAANGALITVGGIGDLNDNPADPTATGGCPIAPRCDDELYSLLPFVANGSTSFTVSTLNPSNDDNIFFAGIVLGNNTAIVGEGISLSPASSTGPAGSNQSVTAHVQSNTGTPINGRSVTFKVVSGPNVGVTGTASTDASGNAIFTYLSTLSGTDSIVASMTNSSSTPQSSNLVSVTWSGVTITTFTDLLSPAFAINPTGTTHTVQDKILNSSAQPVANVSVTFTVASGPNAGLSGTTTTNASGIATFSYVSTVSGTDTIIARATPGGTLVSSNTVLKTWVARTGNPMISLSPTSSTNPVHGQDTLQAQVFDGSGNPVVGATVTFTVLSGPNMGSLGTAVTNASGAATKAYMSNSTGTDMVQASATILTIATVSNIASNTWSGLLCDVNNDGRISLSDVNAIFAARNTLVGPGDVRDADFDGVITAVDLRKCTLACTSAGCQ